MKRTTILTLASLLIGLAFSILLVRLVTVEREVSRQREQIARQQERIAVMRETATQARGAFVRMQTSDQPKPEDVLRSVGIINDEQDRQFEREARESEAAREQKAEADKQEAIKDLDVAIAALQAVSKER